MSDQDTLVKQTKRLSVTQRKALAELRELLTFKRASFARIFSDEADPLPKTEDEVDEFIARRTRLWRNTWVLAKLNVLLGDAEDAVQVPLPDPPQMPANGWLWKFNWTGGGYNQVRAKTREEAIEKGNCISETLTVNESTLTQVQDEDAFWANYPRFD